MMLQATRSCAPDFLHRFAIGHVDDHDGNVDQFGQRDGPVCGFALDRNGTGAAVEMRRGVT